MAAFTLKHADLYVIQAVKVLGEFDSNKTQAVIKGVRHLEYLQMDYLAFNSATLTAPLTDAARAAYVVIGKILKDFLNDDLDTLESTIAAVSRKTFESLCEHYQLPVGHTEALYDDNATMALYQLMGLLDIQPGQWVTTFYDTGRVIPEALSGENPEFLPFNFKPAIDLWNNRRKVEGYTSDIGRFNVDLLEHYTDRYLTDKEILKNLVRSVRQNQPRLLLIPTVTRVGRRLPFIRMCRAVKQEASRLGIDPLVLLDDAQGLGRLDVSSRYLLKGTQAECGSIWDYCDGIVITGAKVTGALMGTGAVMLSADAIQRRQIPFADSKLAYRARQYGYMSPEVTRVREYNLSAKLGCIAHTPELASLTVALEHIPKPADVYETMSQVRHLVTRTLKNIPGLTVLEPDKELEGQFEDSIVSFYLTGYPEKGHCLKQILAERRIGGVFREYDPFPITLPAIITFKDRRGKTVEMLRLSFDPKRLMGVDNQYLTKIIYVLEAIKQAVAKLEEGFKAHDKFLREDNTLENKSDV
ncbi:MAG: hypothetical protein R3A13_03570 [Bdellovibrionota bacterium]